MEQLYFTRTGVYHVSARGVRSTVPFDLAVQGLLHFYPDTLQVFVRRVAPWFNHVACTECGHRTNEHQCPRSEEGLDCPRCKDRGSMSSIYREVYFLDDLDVFEREGMWFWAVAGHYPTGPFETEEDAREDALISVSWVLDEPDGKPAWRYRDGDGR